MRPDMRPKAFLTTWQAFVDESADDRFLVLGGLIATADQWAAFSKDWQDLLPLASLDKAGNRNFKMNRMAAFEDRMAKVLPFWRTIERHVPVALNLEIDLSEFKKASSALKLFDESKGCIIPPPQFVKNPFVFAILLLINLLQARHVLGDFGDMFGDLPILFYFDERSDRQWVLDAYEIMRTKVDAPVHISPTPRFANDEDFLPLQGADLWAYWAREFMHGNVMPWQPTAPIRVLRMQKLDAAQIIEFFRLFCGGVFSRPVSYHPSGLGFSHP